MEVVKFYGTKTSGVFPKFISCPFLFDKYIFHPHLLSPAKVAGATLPTPIPDDLNEAMNHKRGSF